MYDTIPENELNKKYKYIKFLYETYGFDFIDGIIERCVLYRIKNPYAFFKAICEDYISRGIITEEQMAAVGKYKNSRFNCSSRDYDYDILEKRLLGWG